MFQVFSDPWGYAGSPVVVSDENGWGSTLTRPITTATMDLHVSCHIHILMVYQLGYALWDGARNGIHLSRLDSLDVLSAQIYRLRILSAFIIPRTFNRSNSFPLLFSQNSKKYTCRCWMVQTRFRFLGSYLGGCTDMVLLG